MSRELEREDDFTIKRKEKKLVSMQRPKHPEAYSTEESLAFQPWKVDLKVEIDAAFQKALPYFQKAYELEPNNDSYKRSLRSLYYRLGMNAEYEALAD
jgi:hypothetical protein